MTFSFLKESPKHKRGKNKSHITYREQHKEQQLCNGHERVLQGSTLPGSSSNSAILGHWIIALHLQYEFHWILENVST